MTIQGRHRTVPVLSRSKFVKLAASAAQPESMQEVCPAAPTSASRARKKTDIRIDAVTISYEEYRYRAPVKFARAVMDRASILTVECQVRTASGQVAHGVGTMPFNHIFSDPSKTMSNEAKNNAMKALAAEIARVIQNHGQFGHPLELNAELAPL